MLVKIRPLEINDAYTSVQWRNDPEVFRYTGTIYLNEIKIESELEWIRKAIENNNAGKDYRCAILDDGKYIGNIYLTDIHDGIATYHIFIGNKDYWGKGVAKQASLLLLQYAFQQLHLDSVHLRVKKKNINAYMLYKRIGFNEYGEDEEWVSMSVDAFEFREHL